METSAWPAAATTVDAVAELLAGIGSVAPVLTVGVSEITVPGAVVALTLRTNGKLLDAPDASVVAVQAMAPAPPTAGTVGQTQPAGGVNETNVAVTGIVSLKVSVVAAAGPLFLTV